MAEDKTAGLFRQEALERLSSPERLDELMKVVSLKTWLPLATIGVLLGLGLIWSVVGRIPVTTSGRGVLVQGEGSAPELIALLYFDNRYRGQFRRGMPVVLTPETLLVYHEPGVQAVVLEIVEPPALTLNQARQGAADDITANDQGDLEIWAQLTPMAASMPPDTVVPGVAIEGRVTLDEKAPIAFIFPFLDR